MDTDRYTKVGIQRELHVDWFDQAMSLHAMGIAKSAARQEIYHYLDDAQGFKTPPSAQSKTYIANVLIKSWIAPEQDLIALRDDAFRLFQEQPTARLAVHWCLLGTAYPFWFASAAVVGRLLNLQERVTQAQVVSRLKEKFGDRQTVSRRARYIIRSFVSWGALKDSETKGCYEKQSAVVVSNPYLAIFMLEAILLASPEGKGTLDQLLNNPSFFPFALPPLTGDFVSQHSKRIDVLRYGADHELLKIVEYKPLQPLLPLHPANGQR